MSFAPKAAVKHIKFGLGEVKLDEGATVVVRFDHGLEEVPEVELQAVDSATAVLASMKLDPAPDVLARVLGDAVRSVNDAWGVFSRSKIALLPHQLWVCRQVNSTRPARWLVADDVGLGKTIEAGLILLPLIASGEVRRLLILCPAKLVNQWHQRMRDMFDLRLHVYHPDLDSKKSDYWNSHQQVIVSLQTLRLDRNGRHQRLEESEPWDMVVVDEAHHLNADVQTGPTLGYQLVEGLNKAERIKSMVLFTGTPHRGKDYGFLSLLKLLRPEWFNPKQPMEDQLSRLREVMIRNNKQQATDLSGKRLFQDTIVNSKTYSYSPAESAFYEMLSDFILNGKAYAVSLGKANGRAVMLVLIALQKLASSSIAAIRRALEKRLNRTILGRQELSRLQSEYEEATENNDFDSLGAAEELLAETVTSELQLMTNETERLGELLAAARVVEMETKISAILELLHGPFAGRSVLFFTEYKATQSLLLSKLLQRFGPDCATFINGDDRATEVDDGHGLRTININRDNEAERFNTGKVRFLISTEAGGEGIDLQNHCHSLIHVDMPWNPMRLHQRVGRLNRIGQTQPVEVYLVRNPDTVESRIWDHLNTKINRIMLALREVMTDQEDVLALVLGMASPTMIRDTFANANDVAPEQLADWVNTKTGELGGQDCLKTVQALIGNVARFDFQQSSHLIPKLDLPALKPFFKLMVEQNHRNFEDKDDGCSFITPDDWKKKPGIAARYDGMKFDRTSVLDHTLGIGHKLVDLAVEQARFMTATAASVPDDVLPNPLLVFRIIDRITSAGGHIRAVIVAVEAAEHGWRLLRDWEIILQLNDILARRDPWKFRVQSETSAVQNKTYNAAKWLDCQLHSLDLPFRLPQVSLVAVVMPGQKPTEAGT